MSHGPERPRQAPPWWPDEEPWPPREGAPWGWWRRGPWAGRRRRRGGPGWPGFGCLFGLVFLVVLGSLAAFAGAVLSTLGPLPAAVGGLILVAAAVLVARTFRRTAVTLDRLVEAAGRVEAGDYEVRLAEPGRGPRPVRDLVRGFNTMTRRLAADERQRRSLLADVSHELRTPLSVVQGSLEAVVDGVHPADEQHLTAILDETRVLSRLIEDLRTLALSEAGTLALHREPTDLALLVNDSATSFRAAAATARVSLEVHAPASLPLVDVDPVRTREVLSNLIANGLRYTPAGGRVRVDATAERDGQVEDAGQAVRIVVTDTGTGIPTEFLPHVFDRFWKSPESRGSGLGLAIARHLVEAHGGRIGVESRAGDGTSVWFTLPVS